MNASREYKNNVFTSLFDDPRKLISLYNAITGSHVSFDTPVEFVTLDDVLFNSRRNDIAFVIGDIIVVLIEHQSSISENMPLRLLVYISRIYEKLVDKNVIYKKSLLKIPKPDFIVLYNGVEPYPDEKILRLSDAYKKVSENMNNLSGNLDLEVRVLNINAGCNETIVKQCESLYGYTQLVKKVRDNLTVNSDLTAALTKAVKDCINEGILAEYLKKHSSEVINMFNTEWDFDTALLVRGEEEREEGIEIGIEVGYDKSAMIIRALLNKVSVEKIASDLQVSNDTINKFQAVLSQ